MSFSETADFDLPQLEMLEHPLDQRQEQEGPGSGGKGFVSGPSEATWRQYMRPMQMIVLYETKTRLYVIGSNKASTRFRILKFDRTDPRQLSFLPEAACSSLQEIQHILRTVEGANVTKVGQKVGSGMTKSISAFGIAGFVRFLEGYYIVFITRRRRAALIGHHCIYKIEEVKLVRIANDEVTVSHPDEDKYVKMFQNVDMSSNFYFSYSYDLTNTLQHNMARPEFIQTKGGGWLPVSKLLPVGRFPSEVSYVSKPNERFAWNRYLLKGAGPGIVDGPDPQVCYDWVVPVIHGFVDQSCLSVYGRTVAITLIARRSNKYAGTRFLKRGANCHGDVANEVETEQICADGVASDLSAARMTSFVQARGSVPSHWAQDINKMKPKPQIFIQKSDPYSMTSGRHFNHLLEKYGSPVVVLNLVKKREMKRRHEALLGEEFAYQVNNLNTFLPDRDKIKYIHLDMARCKKRKGNEVMSTLADIAKFCLKNTGLFCSQKPDRKELMRPTENMLVQSLKDKISAQGHISRGLVQTGVVRTNCVDCLDRTNTAQFVIGKAALSMQLYALGFLSEPEIKFDSDCARMLEAMYEDHGDTLALQYGGSQLIHRIKSYRKQAPWTSKANDIAQTLRRYYSNTLSDAEKQNTINLFLGVFKPEKSSATSGGTFWNSMKDFPNDEYLHNPDWCKPYQLQRSLRFPGDKWFTANLRRHLPFPSTEFEKCCLNVLVHFRKGLALEGLFADQYRPYGELTTLKETFQVKDVMHSVRDYMPNCCTDFSPFEVRDREGKRREEVGRLLVGQNNPLLRFFFGSSWNKSPKGASTATSMSSVARSPSSPFLTEGTSTSRSSSSNPSVAASATASSDSDDDDLSASEDFDLLENEKHEIRKLRKDSKVNSTSFHNDARVSSCWNVYEEALTAEVNLEKKDEDDCTNDDTFYNRMILMEWLLGSESKFFVESDAFFSFCTDNTLDSSPVHHSSDPAWINCYEELKIRPPSLECLEAFRSMSEV